jgi:rod shape-determining protein MreD
VKDVVFLAAVAVLVLAVQTACMSSFVTASYKPDLFLVFVFWTGLRFPFIPGVGLAFAGGLFVDLLSGSPVGLFAIIYCSTFVACGYLNAVFQIDTPAGRAVTIFAAALASAGIVVLARTLTGPSGVGWNSLLWFASKSLITALSSLALFPPADRLRTAYFHLMGVR